MRQRILGIADGADDVIELNVGGQIMSTTRKALCSAEGSFFAGMFSGNFDCSLKRDKEGRVFLDADPDLFKKVLSQLRTRQMMGPTGCLPVPNVPDEQRAEYDLLVKYYGLARFLCDDIFERIAVISGVNQSALQRKELVDITLSSSGGALPEDYEEVLGSTGFGDLQRALENSFGRFPSTLKIKFLKHRVEVLAMELRAKEIRLYDHMSESWTFRHGNSSSAMGFGFSETSLTTGRLEVTGISGFADEVEWVFPGDFALEHIVLYGFVVQK